jgi:hypothetical protein
MKLSNEGDVMKHIWYGILILAMYPVLGENFDDERTPSGEPTLTPMGVINPFLECVKGNSEMSNYVSIEDQQKPVTLNSLPLVQEESRPEKTAAFDSNAADPYESSDELREDEMKEFLEMVENENNQPLN